MTQKKFRPRSQLTRLERDLTSVLGEDNIGPIMAISRLRKLWPDIVGPMMSLRTEPVRIEEHVDGDRLWVAVDHSIMAQQIRILRNDILHACRNRVHINNLTQIRTQMVAGAGIHRITPARLMPISLQLRKSIARSLQHVDNIKLRRAIFKARLAQLSHSEHKDFKETGD